MTARRLVVLVTGSRTWTDPWAVKGALDAIATTATPGTELIVRHGACYPGADPLTRRRPHRSADYLAHLWCQRHTAAFPGLTVTEDAMPAHWTARCQPVCPAGHRRARYDGETICPWAGHHRNQVMVDKQPRPSEAVAFWAGQSRGTADCIQRLRAAGIGPIIIRTNTDR